MEEAGQRVVVLTGSELRHRFVRKALGLSSNVVLSICEDLRGSLIDRVAPEISQVQFAHLMARAQTEEDFFGWFDEGVPDQSNAITILRGSINNSDVVSKIVEAKPDVIVSYGCSILRRDILDRFPRRMLNVHLGLSPYYRGGGTNFWPLVNGEPEFVGVTFMHIDAGIDTGEIIHQRRARIFRNDNPHQIGTRVISDMVPVLASLVRNFDRLPAMQQPSVSEGRVYRMKDLTDHSIELLYRRFSEGLVENYIEQREGRTSRCPIIENPLAETE